MAETEATLKLLRKRTWGAKAMERRIKRCCADNPECQFEAKCNALYDTFVDRSEEYKPPPKININIPQRKEIYHQLRGCGLSSVEARSNLSAVRVEKLMGDKYG